MLRLSLAFIAGAIVVYCIASVYAPRQCPVESSPIYGVWAQVPGITITNCTVTARGPNTYCVSPSGSDDADGSEEHPLKTMSAALCKCSEFPLGEDGKPIATDTIRLLKGHYPPMKLGKAVTIEGDGADKTIIGIE